MVLGIGVAQDPVVQGVVADDVGVHRIQPFDDELLERRLLGDFQGPADGLEHSLAVVGVAEQLVVEVGLHRRVGGLELMSQVWSNVRTSKWRIRSGSCYIRRPLGISDICPAGSEV